MTQAIVTVPIPFESLVEALKALDITEQRKLYHILEDEIAAMEEAMIDDDPVLNQSILEAQAAYDAGNFVTLDEYAEKHDRMA